jgi:hypothetical protein
LTEGTARKLPGENVPLQRQFLGKEISNLLANRLRKSLPLSSGSSSMPSNDARDVFSILQMLGRNRILFKYDLKIGFRETEFSLFW